MDFEKKFKECNDRYEAAFHLTSAASKIIDSNLTILKVNRALTELMGYPEHELLGTQIMDHACGESKQHWRELQKAMWDKGQPYFKLDACIIRKNGQPAWVHVTTIRFKENGTPYAYTILDDYTARKKLEDSENRLAMALKYSKMAVWELDLDTRSILHSDGFDQLFTGTLRKHAWNEENLLEQFLPEDRSKLKTLLDFMEPGQGFDFQGRVNTTEGVVKWINLQGRAETTPEGRKRLLGTLYDITRDKLAEREKDDFISIASHELKTPLTALKASLQLLEKMKDAPTPKLPVLLEQAAKSMQKVTVLVDDLLNASRLTEGQLHLQITHFNLSKAIDECCLHVTAGGIFEIETVGEKNVEVRADSERIQRVIINFVNNAVKYAPKSKVITIRVSCVKGFVKVAVTDNGPGISKEKIPHIFERFYKADENGGQYSGLGLGLYISSEIVKRHGGEIGVESVPGSGSTFWFTLPTEAGI